MCGTHIHFSFELRSKRLLRRAVAAMHGLLSNMAVHGDGWRARARGSAAEGSFAGGARCAPARKLELFLVR